MPFTEKKISVSLLVSIVLSVALLGVAFAGYRVWQRLEIAQEIIKAQTSGMAGLKSEIQQANHKLGLAESTVVSRDQVIEDYEKTVKDLDLELTKLKDADKVKPISRDQVVVAIEKKIEGGKQDIIETVPGIVAYSWADPSDRFHLTDPDIKISGNEEFSYKLKLRVTGYVLQDETGGFRARQVIAQEVYTENGKEILGPPLEIQNNIYEYAPTVRKKTIFDMWHPRAFVLLDNNYDPGIGVELLNLGNYLDYVNLGVGPFIAFELNKVPGSLPASRLGLGVQYTFLPPLLSTNIGVGLGISSPFNSLLQQYEVTGNVIFYFTN